VRVVRAAVPQENHMRAVCWSPDGSMVAVGFGGRSGHGRSRKDGAFVLLKAADLSAIHEGQDSRDWISEINWRWRRRSVLHRSAVQVVGGVPAVVLCCCCLVYSFYLPV
jgi:hypothetical protein